MIRQDIRQMRAYPAPRGTPRIKLDAMECTYPLPETLMQELARRLAREPVGRYPDAEAEALRARIAELHGIAPEQVLLGNGSDEILQMLMIAADPGPIAVPEPTFVMYAVIAQWLRRPVVRFPLDRRFMLDADRFMQLCAQERAELVFLACPNNPTGNLWPEAAVRRIVDNYMGLVVIDEAYWPYAVRDHLHLVSDHVVVVRTFSKLGWAGLRIGYLIGDAALVQELNKVRLPYNVGRLNQAAALVFLEHWDVFMEIAAKVRAERARLSAMLAEIPGAEVFPSETNFVLVRVPDAVRADAALKQRGIWVKNLHGTHPELHHCLRITVGLPEENDEVVEALASVVREVA